MRRQLEAPWMVLIGPAGTGKTTIGREVAAKTHRPFVDPDAGQIATRTLYTLDESPSRTTARLLRMNCPKDHGLPADADDASESA
ncbi:MULTISPECIES: AAA family ATPase [unclassified Streptomyces]|uniref:AAA family ATPase n=1 Tax=unclassified Streptomyces TaxID=2593676 RepID=UPI0022B6028E|nr:MULTISPECIES: AAA family ATPase [unclassified Streptomyces]MCZ7417112.1 AAA family ATPase [Streptomyces sp. WMMC897]MCZ7433060.1 AAA family ATPase [Streptomyces sp. WMMC1477]